MSVHPLGACPCNFIPPCIACALERRKEYQPGWILVHPQGAVDEQAGAHTHCEGLDAVLRFVRVRGLLEDRQRSGLTAGAGNSKKKGKSPSSWVGIFCQKLKVTRQTSPQTHKSDYFDPPPFQKFLVLRAMIVWAQPKQWPTRLRLAGPNLTSTERGPETSGNGWLGSGFRPEKSPGSGTACGRRRRQYTGRRFAWRSASGSVWGSA